MDSVVVGEFSYQKPVIPVVLPLVYEEAQELLDLLVDTFSLAVTLILSILLSPHMKFGTNWGPLSLITSLGSLCSFQTPSQNNQVTPSEVISDVVAMKWAC